MSTVFTGPKKWDEVAGWFQRFPFGDSEPYPAKITPQTAYFMSWGPDADGLHRTPNPIYFSTKAMTTGVFSLAPGDYFKPGNHPNPESYVILKGMLWVGHADTGQYHELHAGDAYVIPAFTFHLGYNFGDETVEILFMIARTTHTDQMRTNPTYDDHYQNFRHPILLHPDVDHQYQRHKSWAQPGFRKGEVPPSRLDELHCWPPRGGKSVNHNPEVDHVQIVGRQEWLHFVTGKDYQHQFVTSFCYSTDEFQTGKIKIPPGRVTNAIRLPGERVYYPQGETPLVVILSESGNSLIGSKGDALFVPANTVHQFQNPGHHAVEGIFVSATREGIKYY
ncbi:MAG TPA: cupin domain-containing protein [Terriglobia bacterium]|jgi:quercetin dioxygenase-like cupin family protein|nr:cupin domain-containing protein [Terriglobia bacterium]